MIPIKLPGNVAAFSQDPVKNGSAGGECKHRYAALNPDTQERRGALVGRLFFALWPPRELAHRLDAAGAALGALYGGRSVPAENIHITLVFIGQVGAELGVRIAAAGADLAIVPFELVLDQAFVWPRNRVAGLLCSRPPPALARLVSTLRAKLSDLGLTLDRRPFAAHVTLRRDVRRRLAAGDDLNADLTERPVPGLPVAWPIKDFVLVSSQTLPQGSRYRIVRRYPL